MPDLILEQQRDRSRRRPEPGSHVRLRHASWKVERLEKREGLTVAICRGISGVVKDKIAHFVLEFERAEVLDPADVQLVHDPSSGYADTKLFLEAAFRATPTTTRAPLTLGRAAIDDLAFQHRPVEMALSQDRVRLLIGDDVGLGKTLEVGLITSELHLRGRARRVLVVTTRSMLGQFQREFWTRFSIPLTRLDSAALQRMRSRIPPHYNVFDQFERSIVSIDTLKRDPLIIDAIEKAYWDLIILDEAHNAASRKHLSGGKSQRAKLAHLLSRRSDSLLLLTATPHDGSEESFASLVEMLDPTRVPSSSDLDRRDIEDLVIRRFRSSPEVIEAIRKAVPRRTLHPMHFPLSRAEDEAYRLIAELDLDLDAERRGGKAIELFRTTLAKAIFSSPAACSKTVKGRLERIKSGQAKGSERDVAALSALADATEAIGKPQFSKYQALLDLLREAGWDGTDPRDRLVIFSERIATVSWLAEELPKDLGLSTRALARVDGGNVEADTATRKTLEDFGQESSPLRILIASDMASEGLNLHFQCHRLIHFDLPWSLLRFQQRNGRIDRYGQKHAPRIYYFVGESSHPKVRDMWVLDKLVEKDEAAQRGVGDPAVFLGRGDPEGEEEETAEAIASGQGAEAFGAMMDERVEQNQDNASLDDAYDALFGDYQGVLANDPVDSAAENGSEPAPPRLFPDLLDYARRMLERLASAEPVILSEAADIHPDERLISLKLPEDMRARDLFGHARKGRVDDRFMPPEAVPPDGRIELTDRAQIINTAIDQARSEDRAWPRVQYLWEGHPILGWFREHAETFFPETAAPVCFVDALEGAQDIAVLLHGAIPNKRGAPVVDRWGVVRVRDGKASAVGEVEAFLREIALAEKTPNRGAGDLGPVQRALPAAVDRFQDFLVEVRKARQAEIEADIDRTLTRLAEYQGRFRRQLTLDLGGGTAEQGRGPTSKREAQRQQREQRIDQLFNDWTEWFTETKEMVEDPKPYVEVKAVFAGRA